MRRDPRSEYWISHTADASFAANNGEMVIEPDALLDTYFQLAEFEMIGELGIAQSCEISSVLTA